MGLNDGGVHRGLGDGEQMTGAPTRLLNNSHQSVSVGLSGRTLIG